MFRWRWCARGTIDPGGTNDRGMNQDSEKHLQEPVLTVASKDFNALRKEWTVEQALHAIRRQVVGEKLFISM